MLLFFGGSIFVHELGHYLAAKWRKLKIERFSIGFGPRLFGWKNKDGTNTQVKANSVIEWNGSSWAVIFDPATVEDFTYLSNITTGIQYKWDGIQWLKSFEGEYAPGYWRLDPEGA